MRDKDTSQQEGLGFNPATWGLSAWSLHILPVFASTEGFLRVFQFALPLKHVQQVPSGAKTLLNNSF